MKTLVSSFIFLFSISLSAKTIKIAVIDTGFNTSNYNFKLCSENEQYDFTNTGMFDVIGHGQNVTHIISYNLSNVDYCIIPIKVFSYLRDPNSASNILSALRLLTMIKVDIINMSFVGDEPIPEEKKAIELLQSKGVLFVAAAGNDSLNLDVKCNAFPVCYNKQIISVGNWEIENIRERHSNYGKYIRFWQIGTNVRAGGVTLSGTSQACAKETALIARQLYNKSINISKED